MWSLWANDHYLISTTLWDVVKCQSDAWSWNNLQLVPDTILEKTGSTHCASTLLRSWSSADRFVVSRAYDFFRSKRSPVRWYNGFWEIIVLP